MAGYGSCIVLITFNKVLFQGKQNKTTNNPYKQQQPPKTKQNNNNKNPTNHSSWYMQSKTNPEF